ncbi:UNVERIFIED_ASMBLY: hypothetical protein SD1_30 [Shigella phage 2019SD1]|uniref:Uncharacterized protein n=1 Tax=Shigella phage 2019SD1 TaxID=2848074 RepID=A0A6M5CCJ3_9CAUD|nr:tail fiber protein [Shigella phage 2019SD1]
MIGDNAHNRMFYFLIPGRRVGPFDSVGANTIIYSPDGSYRLVIRDDGLLVYQKGDGTETKPFEIATGGTGATDAAGARNNLGLGSYTPLIRPGATIFFIDAPFQAAVIGDNAHNRMFYFLIPGRRVGPFDSVGANTIIYSPDGSYRLVIRDDGLLVYQKGDGTETKPFEIATGGTGATDAAGARNNLGLGTGQDVQFKSITATDGDILVPQTHVVGCKTNTGGNKNIYLTNLPENQLQVGGTGAQSANNAAETAKTALLRREMRLRNLLKALMLKIYHVLLGDAQGYITGYDTKWREQLTLIRPGATIFFIDAPFQAAVISEVISDTQIRAITTGGAEIGRSNYIILLHDSITVDGPAQDVAETLRYYQSKETQIEEAIEFFKNFDLKQLQDLANQVKGDAEKTANDRAATEQLKNDTQHIKDSAVAETNQIKADTNAIKAQTQQIKDSAITEVNSARDQGVLAVNQTKDQAVSEMNQIKGDVSNLKTKLFQQGIQPSNTWQWTLKVISLDTIRNGESNISEVISDTQIRAITTGGAEIGRSNYIILLHDSITVDGPAQDVAETLRYYQSKETQIEEAIEFFKNFDLKQLQDLANQVKGDAEKTANDRAATEQLKNDTQHIKDSAVAETNQIKADTNAIKAQTQQIKDSAITEVNSARDQGVLAVNQTKDQAVSEMNQIKGDVSNLKTKLFQQGIQPSNTHAFSPVLHVNVNADNSIC